MSSKAQSPLVQIGVALLLVAIAVAGIVLLPNRTMDLSWCVDLVLFIAAIVTVGGVASDAPAPAHSSYCRVQEKSYDR